jgi:hypothetical protein
MTFLKVTLDSSYLSQLVGFHAKRGRDTRFNYLQNETVKILLTGYSEFLCHF